MADFNLCADFAPTGDQPAAIDALVEGVRADMRHQCLLGVTGSGKTFTIANVVARVGKPTLVIAHNKTLAAQLFAEFKAFFPENAVEYFVSYYDYYQPEAYIPTTDTFIEKDALINEEIDRLRHSATRSLLDREDVIVVASVSCIYGIGSPDEYRNLHMDFSLGDRVARDAFLKKLVHRLYVRNDDDFRRGSFRVRGDTVEIFPASSSDQAIRVEFFGDDIDAITEIDPLTGARQRALGRVVLYPNSHWLTGKDQLRTAIEAIEDELRDRIVYFRRRGKELEAQRIEQRTMFDLELLQEFGHCHGIENYSRHLSGRKPGEPPYTLIDYFPEDLLVIIDESHVTVPQLGGMYEGDHSRKTTLVEHGFRLPSALDNRPLRFQEFEKKIRRAVYVSATPGPYELDRTGGRVIEQVIRPTGLVDPPIEVRPVDGQVDDLLGEIRDRSARGERILVTTLTKRMAEDLSEHYRDVGVRARYLHADIDTLERVEIIRGLRAGEFEVLVGINLLREGLDLPEVSLVAVLDADKEGFLRSERSLIQTAGRAARNLNGKVIFYADRITRSMESAMRETDRRRGIQRNYNERHGIVPAGIIKSVSNPLSALYDQTHAGVAAMAAEPIGDWMPDDAELKRLEEEMRSAARNLEFERAGEIRDRLKRFRDHQVRFGVKL